VEFCPQPGQAGFHQVLLLDCLLCDILAGRACRCGQVSDYRLVVGWLVMCITVCHRLTLQQVAALLRDRSRERRESYCVGRAICGLARCFHRGIQVGESERLGNYFLRNVQTSSARFKNSGGLGAKISLFVLKMLQSPQALSLTWLQNCKTLTVITFCPGSKQNWITSSQLYQNLQFINNIIISGKYWSQTEKFLS